jgi:SAM-dependent MidA family methyltransferase
MDQQTLIYTMTAFVVVSAIALVIQMGTVIAIYKATKEFQTKGAQTLRKVEAFVETATTVAELGKKQILEITIRANEILDGTKAQIVKVDNLLTNASSRAMVQMDRAELVLDDTMSRVQETVALVHGGITRPLREINGIAAGVRAAVSSLARGGRPSVAQATSDEEMFI